MEDDDTLRKQELSYISSFVIDRCIACCGENIVREDNEGLNWILEDALDYSMDDRTEFEKREVGFVMKVS